MHRLEHLRLLGADVLGVEGDRRLHRRHGDQLEQVIGHHVAQRSGLFVEISATFDADAFGHRDLDMIDAVAIPDRLEQSVGETQRHDVLHRFLSQEMIDAVDLVFLEIFEQAGIERLGGILVMAEWLFHDQAAEATVLFGDQARFAQLAGDGAEEPVGHRHIEEHIAAEISFLVDLGQARGQPLIGFVLLEIAVQK